MALVHKSYHLDPLESSRLSQRDLLARIFGHHEAETGHVHDEMEFEEQSADSGSDYEMDEYHQGMNLLRGARFLAIFSLALSLLVLPYRARLI